MNKTEIIGFVVVVTALVTIHFFYARLVIKMKKLGLAVSYWGLYLNMWPNLREYKKYCNAKQIPFGTEYRVVIFGHLAGYAGALLFLWGLIK